MKQIILQPTRKQYDDLVKLLDRRCTIRTGEIEDFRSVREMVRSVRLVDTPENAGKRVVQTIPLARKPTESVEAPPVKKS